jgi:hypothetical protein
MTRLDLDPTKLIALLKKADTDLRELKNRQYAGASDINIVVNSSANAYDYADDGALNNAHTIDFTSDTMPNAFVDIYWTVAVDSPTNIIHPDNILYPRIDSLQFPKSRTGVPTDASVLPGVTRFVSHFGGTAGHTYYLKYYVQSTDTGTFVFS